MTYSIETNYGDHTEERHGYRSLDEAHKEALRFIKELGLNYPDAFVLVHNADKRCVEHLSYDWDRAHAPLVIVYR